MKKAKKDTFCKMGTMAEKRANVKYAQSTRKKNSLNLSQMKTTMLHNQKFQMVDIFCKKKITGDI